MKRRRRHSIGSSRPATASTWPMSAICWTRCCPAQVIPSGKSRPCRRPRTRWNSRPDWCRPRPTLTNWTRLSPNWTDLNWFDRPPGPWEPRRETFWVAIRYQACGTPTVTKPPCCGASMIRHRTPWYIDGVVRLVRRIGGEIASLLRAAAGVSLLLPGLAAAASADTASAPADTTESIWERDTLTGSWGGMRTSLEEAGVKLGLQEQSELWANVAGGSRRGAVYDGLTTASVALDLEKLIGWTGAKFFVSAYQIHGRGPSGNLVGNLQGVSNIEATRDTKLYQLWLEQSLLGGHLTIRIGQEGANDQMMISRYSALFLNSSFGFPGLPAADLPSGGPNYPMATPFVRAQFQATDNITLVGAVFNGDPAPPGLSDPQLRDKGGIAFRLNDHVLAFSEIWYSINQGGGAAGLSGTYKLGAWYDSGHFSDQLRDTLGLSLPNPVSSGVPRPHSTAFAIYGIVDQMIWKK